MRITKSTQSLVAKTILPAENPCSFEAGILAQMVEGFPELVRGVPLLSPRAAMPGARRLTVMSNRAPIRIVRDSNDQERIEPTVGGVGTTFLRLLERNGGLWIAWSGSRTTPARVLIPPV